MNKKQYVVICLIAVVLMISGCSTVQNGSNAVLDFFGFNQPAGNNGGQPGNPPSAPQSDTDPFGIENKSASVSSGSSLADLDWDEIDAPLIETDDSDLAGKSSSSIQDDWNDDPAAWSFNSDKFAETSGTTQQKQGPQPYSAAPNSQGPSIPPGQYYEVNRREPELHFYRIDNCPVFCPMHELPRTGLTAGMELDLAASVSYSPTNMSLSIPSLNVNEDIVIVPLVDDTYPVEGLGDNVGLLEGSGPGPEDLFVLAGHNHLNTESKGPFVELSALKESDLIFVRGAKDATRTFVVYANEKFSSYDMEGLLTYVKPGCMILITCEDESIEGGYLNRRVIFAEAKEN